MSQVKNVKINQPKPFGARLLVQQMLPVQKGLLQVPDETLLKAPAQLGLVLEIGTQASGAIPKDSVVIFNRGAGLDISNLDATAEPSQRKTLILREEEVIGLVPTTELALTT